MNSSSETWQGRANSCASRAVAASIGVGPQAKISVSASCALERLASQAKGAGLAKLKLTPPAAKSGAKHADLLALERDMSERLGLRVTIEAQGESGTLSIAYKSIDQLDDILDKLSRSK